MGWRLRKSIQIIPGVRLNVSKSGIGYSVGGRGFRLTKRADGRVQQTVSIPGTGLSHVSTVGSRRNSAPVRQRDPAAAVADPPPRPGLFAPRAEKDLYAALFDNTDPARITAELEKVGRAHPELRVLAAAIDGLLALSSRNTERARELLAEVLGTGEDPAAHPFAQRYLSEFRATLSIASGVTATLPLGRDAVGLALAELHQAAGNVDDALAAVRQLPPSAPVVLSAAELLFDLGRYDEVVDVTDGVSNDDDATALLCVLRGAALRKLGYLDAAREVLKEALRSRARAAPVRHRARIERAWTHLAQNKPAMARKDLERVLAEDSDFPGLAEALARLPAPRAGR